MRYSLVPLCLVGLLALAGCAPLPAAPGSVAPAATATPAISTTSAPAVPAPTTVAQLPASPTAEPSPAPAAATVAPGFTTQPTPQAGFASDYPAGWSTYADGALGVSLAVPPEWELCQDTGQSRLFCLKQAAAGGPAFPRFYVTVMPQGFTNADWSAYDFIAEEHVKALMALPVGSSRATNDLPAYSTFTRLADTSVNGRPAVTIENAQVWEGGANTKDRRMLVNVGTATYMFGAYYETPAQLAEFERVLARVRISAAGAAAPQDRSAACPSPTDDLQRLVNPVNGYCLAYPAEYKVEKPGSSVTLLVIGGLLNAGDPRAHIRVTDAPGITLEEAAQRVEAENPGFDPKRSQTTVAGEPAVVFAGLPGEDVNRRVLFVHDGFLYDLYFAPADPANANAYARLETLYKQVIGSFTFIPRSSAVADDCLSPSSTTRLLSDPGRGFCLLYPAGFTPAESAGGATIVVAGSPGGADRSQVVIQVTDAGSKTAEQLADEWVAGIQRGTPGSSVERSFGLTLGYETAQLLEGVPGPELSRQVLVVHAGKLYHLTFTPAAPPTAEAPAPMQALYDLVVRSFRFIPPGR